MLASRLLLSMAVLGLARAGSPAASAQDPKSAPTPPGAGKDQASEGLRGEAGLRPAGRPGPRGMASMPNPGPTELPILPALPDAR